jgi:hypothetical protein
MQVVLPKIRISMNSCVVNYYGVQYPQDFNLRRVAVNSDPNPLCGWILINAFMHSLCRAPALMSGRFGGAWVIAGKANYRRRRY